MSDDADANSNTSNNAHIDELIDERLRDPLRRSLLIGSIGAAVLPFVGGSAALLAACSVDKVAATQAAPTRSGTGTGRPAALGFAAVTKSTADSLTVADGYSASVLFRLGDPIAAGISAYANNGTDTAASFGQRAGDHHDGLHYFGLNASGTYSAAASDRGLLCINHEAITPSFLHPAGQTIVGGARANA
ncbi:MAG TPA: alkaline phosphatase PhoX, partial [Burkholderiaceae bacterium]|nr:alkaline phosphatase PhoX [Burkholderiaceae bacterium]